MKNILTSKLELIFHLLSFFETILVAKNPTALWHGSLGAMSATFAGHYPWFATYNTLQAKIPQQDTKLKQLGRNAVIGFCSSFVSDTVSNSIRVLKVN